MKKILILVIILIPFLIVAQEVSDGFKLKVMSRNVLYTSINSRMIPALADSLKEADIVGCQELNAITAYQLSKMTGYYFCVQEGLRVIFSKYPIVENAKCREGVKIQLPNGKHVWLFNLHLPSFSYGPYVLTGVASLYSGRALNLNDEKQFQRFMEKQKKKSIDGSKGIRFIKSLEAIEAKDEVIFITGDFNEPSHLDWIKSTVEAGYFPIVCQWPTSIKITSMGFLDSFRELYPNPVITPGFTWTCDSNLQTNFNNAGEVIDEPFDRIDFVYVKGNAKIIEGVLLGPEGDKGSDRHLKDFMSDHRALLTTFIIK